MEDLLQFINSSETKPVSSTRAAKRARHKQRKLEEKARLEAEARAREHLHLREEQRRREEEEEERLKEEFQRLQELQKLRAVKKKKKERLSKDCSKLDMLTGNLRAAVGYSPGSEGIHNGSLELAEEPEASPCAPSQHMEPGPGRGADGVAADPTDARDSRPLLKEAGGKQQGPLSFLLDMMHQHKEGSGKQKLRPTGKASTEPARKPSEPPRARSQAEPKAEVLDLVPLAEQKREERRVSSSKKQPNHIKEEKPQLAGPEPASPSGQAQGGKLAPADSPQPKSRNKKSKKKKGDGAGSAIVRFRLWIWGSRAWRCWAHQGCHQRAPSWD